MLKAALLRRSALRGSALWLAPLAILTVAVVVVGVEHVDGRIASGERAPSIGAISHGFGPRPAAAGAYVDIDFAALPDGALPTRMGAQYFRGSEAGRSASGASIADGRMVHGNPTGDNAASYLETTLGNRLQRIGAIASFADNDGDIALLAWQSSLAAALAKGTMPNAGIHFVASAVQWHFSVWDAITRREVVLMSEAYTPVGAPGSPQAFEITRDGSAATVHLPDGAERTVSDPRIAAWVADDACWELYEYRPTERPAALNAIWAD